MIGDKIIASKPGDGDIIEIDSQKYKRYCDVSTRIHHTAVRCYHLIRYVFFKIQYKDTYQNQSGSTWSHHL